MIRKQPKNLADKIAKAIDLYPCELLFVHRDAEGASPEMRREEIRTALDSIGNSQSRPRHVCVVPVKMSEAWLLFDETAIRKAAGNPNGAITLSLPLPRRVENLPDPKEILFGLIRSASELSGRRLRNLSESRARVRLAELIDDFSPLRQLAGFNTFEADVKATLSQTASTR